MGLPNPFVRYPFLEGKMKDEQTLQNVRDILEGNGDPPGMYLWNTYSINKEDILFLINDVITREKQA
jgi:hypothetical protein